MNAAVPSSAHRLGAAGLRPRNLTSLGKLRGPLMQGQPRSLSAPRRWDPGEKAQILPPVPKGVTQPLTQGRCWGDGS